MDEQINVNNLNGVPNFGHGLPADVPAEVAEAEVVAADPAAPEETKEAAPVELPESN